MNELTILSPPLFFLYSKSEILPMFASVFTILYSYLSICFLLAMFLVWSPFGWIPPNAGQLLPLGKRQVICRSSCPSFLMKFCNWLSNYKCHLCRRVDLGWLQNFRHFCKKGKTSLVNIEIDFHELYSSLGEKTLLGYRNQINLICNDQGPRWSGWRRENSVSQVTRGHDTYF